VECMGNVWKRKGKRPLGRPSGWILKKNGDITHEAASCHNPHNSSNWDSCITRQLG
jgi:hypothetical protein